MSAAINQKEIRQNKKITSQELNSNGPDQFSFTFG